MPARVAAWGGYDVDNYGDRIYPWILEHELRRRAPDLELSFHAPRGLVADRVVPLGPATAARRAELAQDCDAVVIGGGELIHPLHWVLAVAYGLPVDALDADRPMLHFAEGLEGKRVAWHGVGVPFELEGEFAAAVRRGLGTGAYVSVRDRFSKARLERAGVEADISVVPDSALLLPRVLGTPRDAEGPIVVQGAGHMVGLAPDFARALERHRGDRPIALLSTFPNAGDGDFADALAPHLREPVSRVRPQDPQTIALAIAGSAGFVGSSLHGAITATAYGRPAAIVNTDSRSKLEGFAEAVGLEELVAHDAGELEERLGPALEQRPDPAMLVALQAELDAHFDRLAALVVR